MTTTTLSPPSKQRFFDGNGAPLAFGLLTTYAAGSVTPITTYKDSTGVATNTNPIVLNARGECDLWLTPNIAYKLALTDSLGNAIPGWPVDNIINSQLITLFGGVDTGIANNYILTFASPYTTYQNGEVIYFIAANSNTGASTINLNGLGVVSIINQTGSALAANQILANQVTTIMYYNGNFLLLQGAQQGLVSWGGTDTGIANGYIVTLTNQYFAYQAGNVLFFLPANTNTGISTINVKSLGTQAIVGPSGGALFAGQIVAGQLTQLIYTGTQFRIVSPIYAVGSFTCTATGMTTSPTITFFYFVVGNQVTLISSGVSGTSNATTFTLTGFANGLQGPSNSVQSPLISAIDNTAGGVAAYLTIPAQSGGSTVTVNINNVSGNWTNAGTKSLRAFSFSYLII